MMGLLAISIAAAGFLCLCGSMGKHQDDLLRRRLSRAASKGLRTAGFLLLAAALAIDLLAVSMTQGAIYWFGHLSVGAIAAVAVLELRRRAGRIPR
ncbi:MAG: DUF3325 family protein [Acidobacteriota bacterium]